MHINEAIERNKIRISSKSSSGFCQSQQKSKTICLDFVFVSSDSSWQQWNQHASIGPYHADVHQPTRALHGVPHAQPGQQHHWRVNEIQNHTATADFLSIWFSFTFVIFNLHNFISGTFSAQTVKYNLHIQYDSTYYFSNKPANIKLSTLFIDIFHTILNYENETNFLKK